VKTYHRVLTIAGSDSGGGAGIQADLKTFSALGCFGMSVVTALTAQNTRSVTGIHAVPADFVGRQIEAVLSDIGADAVKIGMLHDADIIQAVAYELRRFEPVNVVLDPVMIAKSGDQLLEKEAILVLKNELLPLADIVTPNIPEAEVLLGRRIKGIGEMKDAARELARSGARAVVIKGGHMEGSLSQDIFYTYENEQMVELNSPRVSSTNTHGTGCTFSSALAAFMARGLRVREAVDEAKKYITEALQAGAAYQIGEGHGPVHHFYRFW